MKLGILISQEYSLRHIQKLTKIVVINSYQFIKHIHFYVQYYAMCNTTCACTLCKGYNSFWNVNFMPRHLSKCNTNAPFTFKYVELEYCRKFLNCMLIREYPANIYTYYFKQFQKRYIHLQLPPMFRCCFKQRQNCSKIKVVKCPCIQYSLQKYE